MRKLKIVGLFFTFVMSAMLLVGCGANVSSVMNVTTADGAFNGTRVITLLIENEDLSSVTGGMAGLETVLVENLPKELSYAIAYPSDSQSSIVFTLEFSGIDDYRAKVTNLLNANEDNEIIPEISYEKEDTIFKSGLKYSENFTSFNLIEWYYNALQTADIISESSSDWYEIGTNELIVDGVSVDTSSSFDVDNQVKNCLDSCDVRTTMNNDGTFDRTIRFCAYKDVIKELNKVEGNITKYMKKIATKNIDFESVENEDGGMEFIYTISDATAKQIEKATNTIMQNDSNKFSVKIQPKKDAVGTATVAVTESIDGSYYLDYDEEPLTSYIIVYPNLEVKTENINYLRGEENEIYYEPYAGTTYEFIGDWVVGYENVELSLGASSLKKMNVHLTFTICDSLTDEVKEIAFSALESACKDNGTYSRNDNVATYELSGTPEEIKDSLNAFVGHYVDKKDKDNKYCTIELSEMATSSRLTEGIYGDFYLNLTPILGSTKVYVSQEGATKIVSDIEINKDERFYTNSQVYVDFTTTKLNFITLIVLIVFVVLLGAGVYVCVLNRKELMSFIVIKKKAEPTVEMVEEPLVKQTIETETASSAEPENAPVFDEENKAISTEPEILEEEEEIM